MKRDSETIRIILNKENTSAIRDISIEEDRSIPKITNRLLAEALLKRAVKSLPNKKTK